MREFAKLKQEAVEQIPEAVIKAREEKAKIATYKSMKDLDKGLSTIDISFVAQIIQIMLSVTGNRTQDSNFSNNKIVEVGLTDQKLVIEKIRQQLKANVFGITVGVQYTFANVYKFILKFGDQIKQAGDEFTSSIDLKEYVKFIKEVENVKKGY